MTRCTTLYNDSFFKTRIAINLKGVEVALDEFEWSKCLEVALNEFESRRGYCSPWICMLWMLLSMNLNGVDVSSRRRIAINLKGVGVVLDEFEWRDWGLISMNLNDVVLLLSLCCFIRRFNLAFGWTPYHFFTTVRTQDIDDLIKSYIIPFVFLLPV